MFFKRLHKKITRIAWASLAFLFFLSCTVFTSPVFAEPLPQDELNALTSWPNWVAECGGQQAGGDVTPGPVYVLGDSITVMANGAPPKLYEKKFKENGWQPNIQGLNGRQIKGSFQPDGLSQIQKDKDFIKTANVVVVALGTNGYDFNNLDDQVKETIGKIKDINPSTKLFWVNVIDKNNIPGSQKGNNSIKRGVGNEGTIIDWFSEARGKDYFGDRVHPNSKGINALIDLVYKSVSSTVTNTAVAGEPVSGGQEKPVAPNSNTAWKTPKKGQSLGGVAGTGYTKEEVNQAKAKAKLFNTADFKGGNDFEITTYGPPWDPVEGDGDTSTGPTFWLPNRDGSHGRPRYAVAVDPRVIPYGSLVTVWPNAVNWRGAFLAVDTGGAIKGNHVDVYDWSGDGTKNTFGKPSGGKVKPYTGSLVGGDEQQGSGCCPNDGSGSTTSLTGKNNEEKAYNYFVSKGLSKEQSAGIVGNFVQESSVNPEAWENGPNTKTPPEAGGWGLAQWTPGKIILETAKKYKITTPIHEMLTQLNIVWEQLNDVSPPGRKNVIKDIKNTKTVEEATLVFEEKFEAAGTPNNANRIAQAKRILKEFGGNTPSAPSSGVGTEGADCGGQAGGSAFIDGKYAWPVDLDKANSDSGYNWPCPGNCHHDNTPAFDLASKGAVRNNDDKSTVGKAVFAINGGTITNIHIYQGISGCYSLQLKAEDGYMYWYGHIRRPVVPAGQEKKVKVGEKIAEIGERKCTGNGSYPHLHIDRGKPKGSPGGYVSSRDSGLVPIINKLYEKLK